MPPLPEKYNYPLPEKYNYRVGDRAKLMGPDLLRVESAGGLAWDDDLNRLIGRKFTVSKVIDKPYQWRQAVFLEDERGRVVTLPRHGEILFIPHWLTPLDSERVPDVPDTEPVPVKPIEKIVVHYKDGSTQEMRP